MLENLELGVSVAKKWVILHFSMASGEFCMKISMLRNTAGHCNYVMEAILV